MNRNQHGQEGDIPATVESAKNDFCKRLLNLRVGQRLTLTLEECRHYPPEFHTDGETVYEVLNTSVSHTSDSEESFFGVVLGSSQVRSVSNPVFKITVSRSVSQRSGIIRDDPEWAKHWISPRTGTTRFGSHQWGSQHHIEAFEIVDDIDRCPECDRAY